MAIILFTSVFHLSPLAGRGRPLPTLPRKRRRVGRGRGRSTHWQGDRLYRPQYHEEICLLAAKFLGLGDPAIDTARQADLLADIVGGAGAKAGNLPIMEDAQVVELLLDRRRYARKLFKVVGNAARAGKRFEAQSVGLLGRHVLDDRFLGGADVDAEIALGTGNAVDCRPG